MEYRSNQAIYLQIADMICEKILLKKWKEGERIPSVREVAVSMEVNPNTAVRTFNYLQEKGIIQNKRGIGYFVVDGGFEKTLAMKKEAFMKNDVPHFLRNIKLLRIDINDIVKMYNERKYK